MKGAAITKLGLGVLFLWGGLEKLFTGFLGGVGLEALSGMLGNIGFGFLGGGTYVLAIVVAVAELLIGLVFLASAFGVKKACCGCVKKAAWGGAIIILVAILLVHVPNFDASAAMSWANLLLHVVVVTTCLGFATCDKCETK